MKGRKPHPGPADLLPFIPSDQKVLLNWRRMIDSGLLVPPPASGNKSSYQPFIILAFQRTGSSFLSNLLQSHPDIVCFSEVFHPEHCAFDYPFYPDTLHPEILRFRKEDPRQFLKTWIFRAYGENVCAAGLKIHYPQWEDTQFKPAMKEIAAISSLKIIHLVRENYLDILVSHRMAQKSGKWWKSISELQSMNPDHSYSSPPITIDLREAEAFFTMYEEKMRDFRCTFRHREVFEISYESLCGQFDQGCTNLLEFLGAPQRSLVSRILKQKDRPNEEILVNYSSLKTYFKNSRWQEFFS